MTIDSAQRKLDHLDMSRWSESR